MTEREQVVIKWPVCNVISKVPDSLEIHHRKCFPLE
jgi:hypothetical protein